MPSLAFRGETAAPDALGFNPSQKTLGNLWNPFNGTPSIVSRVQPPKGMIDPIRMMTILKQWWLYEPPLVSWWIEPGYIWVCRF